MHDLLQTDPNGYLTEQQFFWAYPVKKVRDGNLEYYGARLLTHPEDLFWVNLFIKLGYTVVSVFDTPAGNMIDMRHPCDTGNQDMKMGYYVIDIVGGIHKKTEAKNIIIF